MVSATVAEKLQSGAATLLVQHADRMWKAEEQNASRLSTKANLLLSATAAALGFVALAVRDFPERARELGWWYILLVLFPSVVAVGFLVGGGAKLVRSSRLRGPRGSESAATGQTGQRAASTAESESASALLDLPDDAESNIFAYDERDAATFAFFATFQAARELRLRNRGKRDALDSAQKRLIIAAVLLVFALILHSLLVIFSGNGGFRAHEAQNIRTGEQFREPSVESGG